jgi:hypothetical protein
MWLVYLTLRKERNLQIFKEHLFRKIYEYRRDEREPATDVRYYRTRKVSVLLRQWNNLCVYDTWASR